MLDMKTVWEEYVEGILNSENGQAKQALYIPVCQVLPFGTDHQLLERGTTLIGHVSAVGFPFRRRAASVQYNGISHEADGLHVPLGKVEAKPITVEQVRLS